MELSKDSMFFMTNLAGHTNCSIASRDDVSVGSEYVWRMFTVMITSMEYLLSGCIMMICVLSLLYSDEGDQDSVLNLHYSQSNYITQPITCVKCNHFTDGLLSCKRDGEAHMCNAVIICTY